jgi:ribonuclease HI
VVSKSKAASPEQGADSSLPRPEVRLFTDGACSGNPGPGGWAFILKHPSSGKVMRASGAERPTTNNRMELMAVIQGLKALKRSSRVQLVTDSEYVAKGISQWMPKWKLQGWQRNDRSQGRQPVRNVDLWQELDALLGAQEVCVEHVLGHAGHPENEECDRMAVAAYKKLLA